MSQIVFSKLNNFWTTHKLNIVLESFQSLLYITVKLKIRVIFSSYYKYFSNGKNTYWNFKFKEIYFWRQPTACAPLTKLSFLKTFIIFGDTVSKTNIGVLYSILFRHLNQIAYVVYKLCGVKVMWCSLCGVKPLSIWLSPVKYIDQMSNCRE